ncbi:MAG: tyrosine-type recombinase/integrase, partial [Planctomycetaceae bacterium]
MHDKNENPQGIDSESEGQAEHTVSTTEAVIELEVTAELLQLRTKLIEACRAWLARSASPSTRTNYARDLQQFLAFAHIPTSELERLSQVRPEHIAAWRDVLLAHGLTNSSVRRKLTALRSLFSYLGNYGYAGANPAHSDFVDAPAVPWDGKAVGLTPAECRRLIETPDVTTPLGIRDRAILSVLAYSACRVGELAKLSVCDYLTTGGHRVLEVMGKGGKERRVPLHPEACDHLEAWLDTASIRFDSDGPLFRAAHSARGQGQDGFRNSRLSNRAVQRLMRPYALRAGLDLAVTVHSLRVTAITTARERGADILQLQGVAGHSDPSTTLTYCRKREHLAVSP